MANRTLLIDGDTLVFEACAAHEYEVDWGNDLWTLHGDFAAAMNHLKESVKEIEEKLEAEKTIFALSDPTRWRPSVMPSYKNHRTKTRKPITYRPLREFCAEVYNVFQRPTLEGDDVLGILATHPKLIPGEKIVVSIDKDLQTIPGLHVNYQKARDTGDWTPRVVTPAEADRFHLLQALMGDATDGYKGCPSIGPVKADKVLVPFDNHTDQGLRFDRIGAWSAVLAAYKAQGLGEEVALQNARVARICRYTDYDFKKKEVILWNPSK